MKKILLSLSLAAAAVLAAAQDYTDALLLSESNYYGTARSVAMGNAAPEVRAVCDAVTETNEEDGVAVYLEQNLLI